MKATKQLGFMARDQWGDTYHITEGSPRKWLLKHFGRKHASKIYVDTKSGEARHVGWIIAGHWLSVYRVHALS